MPRTNYTFRDANDVTPWSKRDGAFPNYWDLVMTDHKAWNLGVMPQLKTVMAYYRTEAVGRLGIETERGAGVVKQER